MLDVFCPIRMIFSCKSCHFTFLLKAFQWLLIANRIQSTPFTMLLKALESAFDCPSNHVSYIFSLYSRFLPQGGFLFLWNILVICAFTLDVSFTLSSLSPDFCMGDFQEYQQNVFLQRGFLWLHPLKATASCQQTHFRPLFLLIVLL